MRHRTGNHAAFKAGGRDARTDFRIWVKPFFFGFISNEFEGCHQANTACFADQRMVAKGFTHAGLHVATGFCRIARQVFAINDIKVGIGSCGTDRVGRIGPAVANRAHFVRTLFENFPHTFANNHTGKR